LNTDQKAGLLKSLKTEYTKLATDFANKKTTKEYLKYEAACKNRVKVDWDNYNPPKPTFTGTKVFDNFDLEKIREYIDWQPYFIAWEMHGRFPQILTDEVVGKEATRLYNEANAMLDKIISEKWLTATGVIGFWEANATGSDSITVNHDGSELRLETLRQQVKKAASQPNLSLSDFIAPASTGKKDYIGAFSVTMHVIEKHIERFIAAHDDYSKISLQALADRLAEAFAELLHERVRKEFWAYDPGESLSNEELIKEKYRGIRPAPGYPACPDHTEKYKLFKLLGGEASTRINLTDSLAMYPASSVCGWYFSHPQSQYFGIGKIQEDQFEDYIKRKGMSEDEGRRWLRPILE